ncbi:MAG TPA: GcrA family cell cycle regulator [Hyphomicrobiaceae bacterium]|nr:GcrA family cell cycle regulator [Hyphomicrobiaceae bacterium]
MSWSDERVELLKKLWAEGLSASQIATRLGSVTRNAVIGKVHRLNLAGRATKSRVKAIRPRVKTAAPGGSQIAKRPQARAKFAQLGNPLIRQLYEADAEPLPSHEELDIPLAERKTIQTLVECSCRWPIGDPQAADFHFCGKNKMPSLPYCEFHARRAFQPPQVRRRDRPTVEPVPTVPGIKQIVRA